LQSIPRPVNRDDAIHLLGAAMAKQKTMELECQLARSRFREAQLHAKLRDMKAKRANKRLVVANFHISSINRVITESGHGEILPRKVYTSLLRSPPPDCMPVYSDGSEHYFSCSFVFRNLLISTVSHVLPGNSGRPVGDIFGLGLCDAR
jgi:hypothetical protein